MDQIADKFGDRLVRQHANGYGGIQNRLYKKNLMLGGLLGELTLI